MFRFHSLVLLCLVASATVYAGDIQVWQCSTGGDNIEVITQESIQVGRWGAPHFKNRQLVQVIVKSAALERRGTHTGIVISQKIGTVTKHGPMAVYLLKVMGVEPILRLILLGIDEFRERQKCKWVMQ